MTDTPVYLDYAATTPIDSRVLEAMQSCSGYEAHFGNAGSAHMIGRRAAAAVDQGRAQLAGLLNCDPSRLIFTSGATESDNLAIRGVALARADRGRHFITMPVEHKAVTDPFKVLEKKGCEVTWLAPRRDGLLDIDELRDAFRDDTQLVSIMHVNNETGVIQDIEAIGSLCRERGVLFHTDAAQSAGKLDIDLASLPVDLLSVTAHKFYGPQGIGALYIADRPGCAVLPLTFGGGQERRLRPGTLPVHLIAGFGATAALAANEREQNFAHVTALRDRLWEGISDLDGILRNGTPDATYPGILNVSAGNVEGESLMLAMEPVCVASGSACNATNAEPSYVLRALGLSDMQAQAAVRFSVGKFTTRTDVDRAIERFRQAVTMLRSMAPAA
jgi:cysteine desulfurase